METNKIIGIGIAVFLVVFVLIFIFSRADINIAQSEECYTLEEFESMCNELCLMVDESFCFEKVIIYEGTDLSCLDIGASCDPVNCTPTIEE